MMAIEWADTAEEPDLHEPMVEGWCVFWCGVVIDAGVPTSDAAHQSVVDWADSDGTVYDAQIGLASLCDACQGRNWISAYDDDTVKCPYCTHDGWNIDQLQEVNL